ncbi:MAG: LLM class flavin-dependent oxidoreductase [Chloroflexi bacterium]|nr:LLM class flavin-dependent oxidoreductase [Chloroflexota bacterium]
MDFGIQLPGMVPSEKPIKYLTNFIKECDQMGFRYVSYVDHFRPGGPLLDPLTLSAIVAGASERMRIVPAISIIVMRTLIPMAKHFATMDYMTEGRMVAGIGPGSQDREYQIVGLDHEERWPRFDEMARGLRALLTPGAPPFKGKFYSTEGVTFEPFGTPNHQVPIWIGSWGSEAGLRRVARLADGWLGSALDSTPERFGEAKKRLEPMLLQYGKDPAAFPNAVCTMALFLSDNPAEFEGMGRPPERATREGEPPRQRVMVGTFAECEDKLHRWDANGAQALFFRPVKDDLEQAYGFMNKVASKLKQPVGA